MFNYTEDGVMRLQLIPLLSAVEEACNITPIVLASNAVFDIRLFQEPLIPSRVVYILISIRLTSFRYFGPFLPDLSDLFRKLA